MLTASWPRTRDTTAFTILAPASPAPLELPPFGGTRRGRGPSGGLARPVPATAPAVRLAPAPPGRSDSTLAASAAAVGPHIVTPPQLADGRLWVLPRPGLPVAVAEVLYGPSEDRDTVVVTRLRAMVDSLNRIIDSAQLGRRAPTWTTEVAGAKFGIDSQSIYIAGIKIPTAALTLLGNLLPQGNYDESRRARQLSDMREDLMQAARRTETLAEFRRYVRELRARKQAERDAERRARGDTLRADTVRAIP